MQSEKQIKISKYFFGIIIIFLILLFTALYQKTDNNLHVYFLNVSQGDSIYVRTNNADLLIDGGPDSSVLQQLGKVMPYYDKKIDYVILTHPHADHISGLNDVIKNYDIGEIIATDAVADSSEYREWLKIIKEKNIPYLLARDNDIVKIDNNTTFKIFWPNQTYSNVKIDNLNSTSIVGKLNYKNFNIMFTGDAEKPTLYNILKEHSSELKSQIYKVPHHCSKNATDVDFIKEVDPDISVIEMGAKNQYGFPHKECIDALEQSATKILRTDQNNTVEIISDGNNYSLKQ